MRLVVLLGVVVLSGCDSTERGDAGAHCLRLRPVGCDCGVMPIEGCDGEVFDCGSCPDHVACVHNRCECGGAIPYIGGRCVYPECWGEPTKPPTCECGSVTVTWCHATKTFDCGTCDAGVCTEQNTCVIPDGG